MKIAVSGAVNQRQLGSIGASNAHLNILLTRGTNCCEQRTRLLDEHIVVFTQHLVNVRAVDFV
jgi:hypothetical protein